MVKKFLHDIYLIIGHFLNFLKLCFWRIRDKINPPNEKAVLFVAHPDDDTLFFHTFIKECKPYVVLLTTGWSMRRYPCFKKVMKYYGVKYRAYNLQSRDERINLLEKCITETLKVLKPTICATHNAEGEYGHEMHKRVHNAVKKRTTCKLLVPFSDRDIEKFPLSDTQIKEKTMIFNKYYTTELFVLDIYKKWIHCEKLTEEI
jgi:LmbE family N-acetylglucosaminyl deacetylase